MSEFRRGFFKEGKELYGGARLILRNSRFVGGPPVEKFYSPKTEDSGSEIVWIAFLWTGGEKANPRLPFDRWSTRLEPLRSLNEYKKFGTELLPTSIRIDPEWQMVGETDDGLLVVYRFVNAVD